MSGMAVWQLFHFRIMSFPITDKILSCVTKLSFLCVECTAEEKEPYEAKARVDKKRYEDEKIVYNAQPQPMNIDSGNESDSA